MMILELQSLAEQANSLDKIGLYNLADQIDECLISLAAPIDELVDHERYEKNILQQRFKRRQKRAPAGDIKDEELLMARHGILPLDLVRERNLRSDESWSDYERNRYEFNSFINRGVQGKVFRASYKGREAAVKITWEMQEVEVWRRIQQAMTSAPEEMRKHIPIIYELIESENKDGDKVAIIVMEILSPLTSHMRKKLFGRSDTEQLKSPLNVTIKDEGILYNAVKYALDAMGGLNKDKDKITLLVHKGLLSMKYKEGEDLYSKILDAIESTARQSGEYRTDEDTERISHYSISRVARGVCDYLERVSSAGYFPSQSSEKKDFSWLQDIPEAKNLYKALSHLQRHGIWWNDVHRGNVLYRKQTGDPVLIDVGMYYLRT